MLGLLAKAAPNNNLIHSRDFFIKDFCEDFSTHPSPIPSLGLGELNTPQQKELSVVGPPESSGGDSLSKGAMELAGVGWALLSQLDLREGGGPEHPPWIVLDGWLDAGGVLHHQMAQLSLDTH